MSPEEAACSLISAQSFGQVKLLSWSTVNVSGTASEKKPLDAKELLEFCSVSRRNRLSEREFLLVQPLSNAAAEIPWLPSDPGRTKTEKRKQKDMQLLSQQHSV